MGGWNRGVYAPIESIWSRVDRSGGPEACWLWQGAIASNGYGSLKWAGRYRSSHRVAAVAGGILPSFECEGLVLHSCDNRACCNPAHLYVGTQQQNMADMDARGRRNQSRGPAHTKSKLSAKQARAMRAEYATGLVTIKILAAKYGVAYTTANYILNRRTYVDLV